MIVLVDEMPWKIQKAQMESETGTTKRSNRLNQTSLGKKSMKTLQSDTSIIILSTDEGNVSEDEIQKKFSSIKTRSSKA